MSELPRIAVSILTHDRREMLRRALRSISLQTGVRVHVVVADSASADGSPEMVAREFPEVELLALERNHPLAARNAGLRTCRDRGFEIVLSLDDDIELQHPETLARLCHRFETQDDLGALSLKICDAESDGEYVAEHWWHPRDRRTYQDREFTTDHFSEAAVAFRARALEAAGDYYEDLFWGGEEWDLALALVDARYEIRYFPEPVLHLAPRGSLNYRADPRHSLLIRNRCWIALRRLPIATALAYTLPRLALWGLRAIRYGYLRAYLGGIADLVRRMPQILRERRPVSRDTLAALRATREATGHATAAGAAKAVTSDGRAGAAGRG